MRIEFGESHPRRIMLFCHCVKDIVQMSGNQRARVRGEKMVCSSSVRLIRAERAIMKALLAAQDREYQHRTAKAKADPGASSE